MRKSMMMVAVLAGILAASCEKTDWPVRPEDRPGAKATLRVSTDLQTKATGVVDATEKTINSLQVFVFNANGDVDAYKSGTGTALTLECTPGTKRVYAVANAPSLSTLMTETSLKHAASQMSHNAINNLEMVGSKSGVSLVAGSNNVALVLNRITSRVVVKKISNQMFSPQYQAQTFQVKAIYLTNVASSTSYDLTASPTTYYNQKQYLASPVDSLVYESIPSTTIAYGSSLATEHYLYAYPNPSTALTEGGTWSPRCTRLVIKAAVGSKECYYPINLPAPLLSNKNYVIDDIVITKPGSTNEDTPVTTAELSFSVTVSDWDDVSVGPKTI